MKLSMLMAAAAIVAVTATGCRYDKSNEGDVPGADQAVDVGTNPSALGTDELSAEDLARMQEGTLDELADAKRFEDIYTPCTDVNFAPVYFALDSTVVPAGELGKVEAVAQHLADRQDRVVVVAGHCDERGSNEYNMSLGESRAVIVRNYLVSSGVAPDRIQTRSYGEERPAVMGQGEGVWSQNRRDEFAIFQK